MKRKNNGLNQLKRVMTSMLPAVEKAVENSRVRQKEQEEADRLDMKIRARTKAYLKKRYKELDD